MNRKRRAVTLPEVVIALAVVASALLGLVSLTAAVERLNLHRVRFDRARRAAAIRLDALKATPFANLLAFDGELSDISGDGLPSGQLEVRFLDELATAALVGGAVDLDADGISDESEPAHADMIGLSVRVQARWSEGGSVRSTELWTILTETMP